MVSSVSPTDFSKYQRRVLLALLTDNTMTHHQLMVRVSRRRKKKGKEGRRRWRKAIAAFEALLAAGYVKAWPTRVLTVEGWIMAMELASRACPT